VLDNLVVAVRPRSTWESVELGFAMVREWFKPIYAIWLLITLPFFLVLCFTLGSSWAIFVFWWFKPLYDRLCLSVLSQATFGHVPTLKESLSFFKKIFNTDLILALSWLRLLDFSRSFTLPVRQLEGLEGKPKRQRLSLLKRRGYASTAGLMSLSYAHLEMILIFVPLVFFYVNFEVNVLSEQAVLADSLYNFWRLFFQENAPYFWMTCTFYYIAVSVIGPFFVASGFSLYLNRRTHLESWDIEVTFKKLAKRIESIQASEVDEERVQQHKKRSGNLSQIIIIVLCLLNPMLLLAEPSDISDPIPIEKSLRSDVRDILEDIKYGGSLEKEEEPKKRRESSGSSSGFSNFLGSLMLVLMWIVIIIAVISLAYYLTTLWKNSGKTRIKKPIPPETLFGMDIRIDRLPDDVAKEALKLWRENKTIEAMSLLYRGALAFLAHSDRVELGLHCTEGDCIDIARHHLAQRDATVFENIARSWQITAYAHRFPEDDAFQALCREYNLGFGGGRG